MSNPESLVIRAQGASCTFAVAVTPRAKRSEVTGVSGGALSVRLHAPPVDGKANEALLDLLGTVFGVRSSQLRLVRGQKSRQKVVEIDGLEVAEIQKALVAVLTAGRTS